MCGRYSLTRRQTDIIERFGVLELLADLEEMEPRFNIAPSQRVPVIINIDNKRTLAMYKWGLVPFWAKDLAKTKPIINARAETMAEKPFFKQAVKSKRCLIPADGFYEWKQTGKTKTPMYIHEPGRQLFAFAGLWDEWRSPDGEVLRTCTIITTGANQKISSVHDRMPVIVRPDLEGLWLNPELKELKDLQPVLQALPEDGLDMYPVSPKVNSARGDSPDMVEPAPAQTSLFDT